MDIKIYENNFKEKRTYEKEKIEAQGIRRGALVGVCLPAEPRTPNASTGRTPGRCARRMRYTAAAALATSVPVLRRVATGRARLEFQEYKEPRAPPRAAAHPPPRAAAPPPACARVSPRGENAKNAIVKPSQIFWSNYFDPIAHHQSALPSFRYTPKPVSNSKRNH